MEIEINWLRALLNFSEGINWLISAYLLIMWRWLTTPFKWLAAVFIDLTLGVVLSNSAYIFFDLNNRFIFHLRSPIHFILISMIFYTIIESAILKSVIIGLIIIFPLYCILNSLFIESFWYSTPTVPETITHLVVIIYSIYFIYDTFVNPTLKFHAKDTYVILVLSLFFYYASTLVQEMTFNLIGYNNDLHKVYNATVCFIWIIHNGGILYTLRMIYKDNYVAKKNSFLLKQSEKTTF
jgi:hypothetical protein